MLVVMALCGRGFGWCVWWDFVVVSGFLAVYSWGYLEVVFLLLTISRHRPGRLWWLISWSPDTCSRGRHTQTKFAPRAPTSDRSSATTHRPSPIAHPGHSILLHRLPRAILAATRKQVRETSQ